jgi:hypothetical protein
MKNGTAPLHFRGAPTRLLATLEWKWPRGSAGARVCQVNFPESAPLPLTVRQTGSESTAISILSFRMPRSTPPGSYKGSARLGETQIPIVAEVEARPRLRFIPARVALTASPGARIRTEVDLLNLGNVEVSIERESTFCVFDNRGVDQALFRGLTESGADGKSRIDRFLDELAESHGGLVRVQVASGGGRVVPGELRKLSLDLQFSRRLKAGHTYRGAWPVSEASLEVQVEAAGKSSAKERNQ